MEDSERWAFLYANPAVLDLGWFPPPEEVPELGDLRRDHARLIATRAIARWMNACTASVAATARLSAATTSSDVTWGSVFSVSGSSPAK